jgi:coproporphyrinogen III oxidase-like Fe-S oxidoreductase
LWRPECLGAVVDAVRARFRGTPKEITLEANPTDCSDANLAAWRAAGIDRISIGVQSLAADELVVLGRDHRFGDGPAALARVLDAGIAASCDFILGTPTARAYDTSWIDAMAATSVGHLSIYELTIEDRTAFGQRVKTGRLVPRDEDTLADLYIATHDALVSRGFEHYEISSYARPGKRAVHNSLYWRGSPFLGLGVGAASLAVGADGSGERATNPRRAADYIAAPGVPAEVVVSTPSDMRADRAWLGMRTLDGVVEADLPATIVAWLLAEGLADRMPGSHVRISPTLRGFLMADTIAARIADAL